MATVDGTIMLLPGSLVYVPDTAKVWVQAQVCSINNKTCTVTLADTQETRECTCESVMTSSGQCLLKVHSLTELSPINQASVLCCLDERFGDGEIYTSAGSTIIAVNPFCDIQDLYTHENVQAYHEESEESPHIYKVACGAYKSLCRGLGQINQCIIVSGESGSGKTVSAKHLLRYMTLVSTVYSNHNLSSEKGGYSVEQRILDSNPILEAFGNAVTQRNDNSSRFGKFIKLQFSRSGQMVGGEIHTYLLEKTRVVHQSTGEANFHIFYQIMKCLSSDTDSPLGQLVQKMGRDPFRALPTGKCITNNRDFTETLEAMTQIGLSEHFQNEITKILVGILFLCNVKISPLEEEICQLLSDKVTQSSLKQAASLLGLETSHIEQVFLYRNIQSGGNKRRSVFVKPVPEREANSRRNCLATLLYSRIFEWLVKFINGQIKSDNYCHTIGLLDIYGFEAFETNSLEQLCINYANEKLQQHYVRHFLNDLQREYEEECISWDHLTYTDNQLCLAVLEGQPSVFGLLNEDVQLNRQTDAGQLCERILTLSQNSQYLKAPRNWRRSPGFTVNHYAGDVTYSTSELSTKNRDNVPQEIVAMLQNSTSQFVSELFKDYVIEDSLGRKRKTVLGKFKVSLDSLMSSLRSSDVHYIRCIKPNTQSVAGVFDRPYVMRQLAAGGIIETVKISSLGYPIRMPYSQFLQRYGLIIRNAPSPPPSCTNLVDGIGTPTTPGSVDSDALYEPLDTLYRKQLDMLPHTPRKTNTSKKRLRRRAGLSSDDHTRRCSAVILRLQFGECKTIMRQFGKTKLFLHQHQVDALEQTRYNILCAKAAVIQYVWRRYRHRRELARSRQLSLAACKIQHAWRRHLRRRRNTAVLLLQKTFRMQLARRQYKKLVEKAKLEKKRKTKSWKPIMDRKRTSPGTRTSRPSSRSNSQGQISGESTENSTSSSMEISTDTSNFPSSGLNLKSIEKCLPVPETTKTPGINVSHGFKTSTPCSKQRSSPGRRINECTEQNGQFSRSGKENIPKRRLTAKGRPNMSGISPLKRVRSSPRLKNRNFNNNNAKSVSMETTKRGGDSMTGCSPIKKQKTETGFIVTLEDVTVGDGIMSRRRLPRVPIRFHTRASVLKNAHYVHQKELEKGLQDCLPNNQSEDVTKNRLESY